MFGFCNLVVQVNPKDPRDTGQELRGSQVVSGSPRDTERALRG